MHAFQVGADTQNKLTDVGCESACKMLPPTATIVILELRSSSRLAPTALATCDYRGHCVRIYGSGKMSICSKLGEL